VISHRHWRPAADLATATAPPSNMASIHVATRNRV
jgi:hypothetical protein